MEGGGRNKRRNSWGNWEIGNMDWILWDIIVNSLRYGIVVI